MLDAELAEPGDHDARVLACDVTEDEVASRPFRHVADAYDVDGGRVIEQHTVSRVRELMRYDDAEMDHRGRSYGAGYDGPGTNRPPAPR